MPLIPTSHNMGSPTGAVTAFAGGTAPAGWEFCYGQAVSRTTYASLFAVLSTTYGVGDGSTTFNLPDMRGRVAAGQDDMGGTSANRLTGVTGGVDGDTLAATGGEEAHVQTEAQLATHTHVQNSHTHTLTNGSSVWRNTGGSSLAGSGGSGVATLSNASTTATNQDTGSSTAFNVVQPTIILNYIIKT